MEQQPQKRLRTIEERSIPLKNALPLKQFGEQHFCDLAKVRDVMESTDQTNAQSCCTYEITQNANRSCDNDDDD